MSSCRCPLRSNACNRFVRLAITAAHAESGRADPLYWDAVRFTAARGRIGPTGLMRRFRIGRLRVYGLLIAMRDAGVLCRGHWRGVYRVVAMAWPWLQVVGTHANAPSCPAGYRMYLNGHPAFRDVPGWRAAP